MMRLNTSAWKVAGVVLFLSGSGIARGQAADGFLGIAWGTPLSQLKMRYELVPDNTDGEYSRYSSAIRLVQDAGVNECDLEFIAGRFAGVALVSGDPENSHRLLAYLQRLFGEGHTTERRSWQWFAGGVHVSYDETAAGEGFVYWYCLALQAGLVAGPVSSHRASAYSDSRP